MGNDIGSFFSGMVSAVEQQVESAVTDVTQGLAGVMGGGQPTHGATPVGGGSPADSLGGFDVGGFLSGGPDGIAGGLMGMFGGDAFGIIGNIFQPATDPLGSVAGYLHLGGNSRPPPPPPGKAPSGGSAQPNPAPTHTASAASTGTSASASSGQGIQPGDPRLEQAQEAIEELMVNFSKAQDTVPLAFGGNGGIDGIFSNAQGSMPMGAVDRQSLLKLANDPATPDPLRNAAEFLLNNPDVMNQLCTQLGMPNNGGATYGQLHSMDKLLGDMRTGKAVAQASDASTAAADASDAHLGAVGTVHTNPNASQIAADLKAKAEAEVGADGDTTPTGDAGGDIGDINVDAKKSTATGHTGEFGKAMDNIDQEIAKLEDEINNSNDPKVAERLGPKLKDLYFQKQSIMELEQEFFTMKSEIMKAFHDMSMTAIRNING